MHQIGDRIKELREKRGLTQSELAYCVGTDSTSISRWETNKVKISMKYILKLAKALKTTSDYLLDKTSVSEANDAELIYEQTERADPSFVREIMKGTPIFIYENGNDRFYLPATTEGFNFAREMVSNGFVQGNLAVAR